MDPKINFRKQFSLTFILAMGTAFFWIMQFVFPEYGGVALFGPLSSLLSLVARFSFLVSFLARSANWLAVSAISSTTSLMLMLLGELVFGFSGIGWPLACTWVFSVATLVTYFIQARKLGIKPYVINTRPRGY